MPTDKQISDALNLLRNEIRHRKQHKIERYKKNRNNYWWTRPEMIADFEKDIVGKPCSECKAPSFTYSRQKDIVDEDELGDLAALSNTDVEVILGEAEEGTMFKNAFDGIAAIEVQDSRIKKSVPFVQN